MRPISILVNANPGQLILLINMKMLTNVLITESSHLMMDPVVSKESDQS